MENQNQIIDVTNGGQVSETTTLAISEGGVQGTASLSLAMFEGNTQAVYSSIQMDGSRETAIKVYNAINDVNNRLKDKVKEVLTITDFVAHPITLVNEETGEMSDMMRVVVIDEDGEGYQAVSQGVVSSLQKIVGFLGPAPWNPGIKVMPKMVTTRRGFETMTLILVADNEVEAPKKGRK